MLRRLLFVVALAFAGMPLTAQIRTIGGGGGGNAVVTDSLKRLANGTAAAPSLAFLNSTGTGLYRFGADTLGIATNGTAMVAIGRREFFNWPTITGIRAASDTLAIQASATGTLGELRLGPRELCVYVARARTRVGLGCAGPYQFQLGDGDATTPAYTFYNDTTVGLSRIGADTLTVVSSSLRTLDISGGASASLRGGAGNMTILAGTGASRTLTLQATNSGSTATTFMTAKFDTVRFHDEVVLAAIAASSGTPNAVCIDATSKQLTENAASSCVVSSRRFKQNILPLTDVVAQRITTQLKPSVFKYRVGGRNAIGLIAEEVDSVDSRLATRDGAGRINSVNYEQVTVVLLKQVQGLTAKLDRMCKAGIREAC